MKSKNSASFLKAFLEVQRDIAFAGQPFAAPWPRWFYSEAFPVSDKFSTMDFDRRPMAGLFL